MNAKEYVVRLIKEYPSMVCETERLEFEIRHYQLSLLPAATIEAMTFAGRGASEKINTVGRHSDKTADIAVQHVDSQQWGAYRALQARLERMLLATERLELYLKALPQEETQAVKLIFWSGLSWEKMEEKSDCARTSVLRRKNRGIQKLSQMFGLLMELGIIDDEELF